MKTSDTTNSTKITRKQINVIYAKAKSGDLKIERWLMNELYDLPEWPDYDMDKTTIRFKENVLKILDAVFANDLEKAQELINETADSRYTKLAAPTRGKLIRSINKEETPITDNQKVIVNGEEYADKVNAALDAAIEYTKQTYPNASEVDRTIMIVGSPNSYWSSGDVVLTNAGTHDLYSICVEIGFLNGEPSCQMYSTCKNENEFNYHSRTYFTDEVVSEILALVKEETPITDNQKAIVDSEEYADKVNAALDAAIEYTKQTYPNSSEISRQIMSVESPNSYKKSGSIILTNAGTRD